jgi:hypothetical protein
MTKTISQKLRELAQGKAEVPNFWWLPHSVQEAIYDWKDLDTESWIDLNQDERRTFCEFVACALESEQ